MYLVSKYSPKTLRSYAAYLQVKHFSEEEACGILALIAFGIEKLHRKSIMHRNLSMESVTVKIKDEDRLFMTLSSFDFAYHITKDNTAVKQ